MLVADGHLAVVEGVLRQKVRRKRDLIGGVANGKIVRHDVRIVRTIKRHVGEERAASLLLDEADRFVGKDFAGVFGAGFGRGDLSVHHVAQFGLHGVCHATGEHGACDLEHTRQRGVAIVPFAAGKRGVAGLREGFRPRFIAHQLLVDVKQVLSRKQHGTRWHAGGPTHAALHVGPAESDTALCKPVEIRCLDHRIAKRGDGVRPLIIGEKEQDVRLGAVCSSRERGEAEKCEEEMLHESGGV